MPASIPTRPTDSGARSTTDDGAAAAARPAGGPPSDEEGFDPTEHGRGPPSC